MMPLDDDLMGFLDILPVVTVRLDTIPHWLQVSSALVMAFLAASLLVGFYRQTTPSLHTHKDSL